jgi:chemotaxis protein histidine kinase CheA
MKDSFKDIGTEILADTVLTAALIKMQQTLRDSQRDLNVETAQQRAEIERLKLIAEDVTKSTKVRLEAAKEAFAIENRLLNDRIANAKEDLRLQQESMRMTAINKKNTEEELDREAELKINLANITGESLTKQIELNNKINAITAEAAAKAAEALQAQKDAREELLQEDLEFYQNLSAVQKAQREKELEEDHQFYQNLSKMIKEASDKEIAEANRVAAAKEQITKSKRQMDIDIANQSLALISIAAGEGTAISKAAAIAQATIAGHQSVINAFNSANANVGATAGTFGAYPVTMAALAAAFAASNIAKIASTSTSGGSSGVFSSTSGTTVAPQSPAPQMMSGAFDLSGGMQPDPVKAFVVTDEMTNSQNQLANIRRRSTI